MLSKVNNNSYIYPYQNSFVFAEGLVPVNNKANKSLGCVIDDPYEPFAYQKGNKLNLIA